MRLIDADSLKAKFKDPVIMAFVKETIDNEPTVDAVKRKTGHWLRTKAYPHRIYCSVCYATFIRNDEFLKLKDIQHNYCPACGAEMRGKDNGESRTNLP